jgi:hypothetical protein
VKRKWIVMTVLVVLAAGVLGLACFKVRYVNGIVLLGDYRKMAIDSGKWG